MSEENNNEAPEEVTEAPAALSADDVKSLVGKSANAAVTQRISQLEQRLEEKFTSTLTEALAGFQPVATEPTGAGDSDNEVKAMRARLKDMEALVQAGKAERDQERSLRNTNEERTALRQALQEEGVPAERLKAAVAVLYTEDKRIDRDEDGTIRFLTQEQDYVDRSPVREGVAKFLATDEGKLFMPARAVSGSGNTGGRPPRDKAGKPSFEDEMRELADALLK